MIQTLSSSVNVDHLSPSFRSDGSVITDPAEIANGFCNYFTNVGPKLAAKIPPVNTSYQSFLNDQTKMGLLL